MAIQDCISVILVLLLSDLIALQRHLHKRLAGELINLVL